MSVYWGLKGIELKEKMFWSALILYPIPRRDFFVLAVS